jgi:beta-galactosidase
MRLLSIATFLSAVAAAALLGGHSSSHAFDAKAGQFQLDGQPYQIISGEMHYPRIPRAYWRNRFLMAKAMGLNTITTYVFWNVHEPQPGQYDFSGNNDVAEFVREAQQEGLNVILRPGPYVCAEWEFGGYPAWLLKDHSMIVRSRDPKYMAAVEIWLKRLGQELSLLQVGKGGPIIAVQIENEYGSFGDDHAYMQQMRHLLLESGFANSLLYTADGPEQVPNGSLPGTPAGVNFGGGDDAKQAFAVLKKYRPEGPFLNSEYWAGWFDHWGSKHAHTDVAKEVANLDWMLSQGYSVSFYMFHGGTSFGWMNGANSNGKNYQPDVTSYDYDSALDESGRPAPKYFLFRDVIAKRTGRTPPSVPEVPAPITVAKFNLEESASLWENLPAPVHSKELKTMEDLDQAYGYILYRTTLTNAVQGDLVIDGLHDYARVYLNGSLSGTVDRRLGQNNLKIEIPANTRLDILVENTGRVNFTTVLRGERKGITNAVLIAGKPVIGWEIYSLPMTNAAAQPFASKPCYGPCFYRATFSVNSTGDTFLDTGSFSKGQVWLNGQALGRVWDIGPQRTLYVPGPWLKTGTNEVVVFDLNGKPGRTLEGLAKPNLGQINREK